MEIKVSKFTEDLKELILERKKLVDSRQNIEKSIRGGRDYFEKLKTAPDIQKSVSGAVRMIEVIEELDQLNNKIFDIDTVIVSTLEMNMGNFTAKIHVPERLSQAGDVNKGETVHVVPYKLDDVEYVQISPEDIWFLKMIKQAIRPTNISFELKESNEDKDK